MAPLQKQRIIIKKEKFKYLQQLKILMEKDFHSFYDNLPKM